MNLVFPTCILVLLIPSFGIAEEYHNNERFLNQEQPYNFDLFEYLNSSVLGTCDKISIET